MDYKLPISIIKSGQYDARTLLVASYLCCHSVENEVITCVNFITLGIGLFPNRGTGSTQESVKSILKRFVKEGAITVEGNYKKQTTGMLIIKLNPDSELFGDRGDSVLITKNVLDKLMKTRSRRKDCLFATYIASQITGIDSTVNKISELASLATNVNCKAVSGYMETLSSIL